MIASDTTEPVFIRSARAENYFPLKQLRQLSPQWGIAPIHSYPWDVSFLDATFLAASKNNSAISNSRKIEWGKT